ncbi:ribosomal large subunit pseudouridine synthase A [mine drainage metagenome]|uniref:Ribosomal large subunit pseudouridine synthase A n=1 Tax=mine drainage metagenome TaxID=410659 RepID=A0A1J5RL32_9ZZZZ
MASTPYRPPVHQGLSLLYLSEQLIVVDKPSGLLSVPGHGAGKEDCLSRRVQAEFPDAMIVHRLDMGTSGIVVMGRGATAQRELSILFQERKVRKRYQALVDGHWTAAAAGEIELPIGVDWPNHPKQKVDHATGRPSLTRYRVLDIGAARTVSRIELEAITGRSHQLRVHMEAMGHPILGDDFYGTSASCAKAERLMLHACQIELRHPETGALLRFDCPPPF